MRSRGRGFFGIALAALSILVIGASVAWACTPPGFGSPSSPAAPTGDQPPPPSQPEGGTQPSEPTPATSPTPAAQPNASPPASQVTTPGRTDSRSTSGAGGGSTETVRGGRQPAEPGTGSTGAPAAAEQFEVRENGGTAGVVEQGRQPVFASSTASKAKKKADPEIGAAPSERSAVGDAWTGFASEGSPAGSAAATSLGEDSSGSTTLGLAILGLGLVGVAGAFLVLAGPGRRRAHADSKDRGPSAR